MKELIVVVISMTFTILLARGDLEVKETHEKIILSDASNTVLVYHKKEINHLRERIQITKEAHSFIQLRHQKVQF